MKKIILHVFLAISFQYAMAQNCIENTNSNSFDGFSSYASTANQGNLNITDSLTVEAWIYPTAFDFNSAQNSIVCKHGWSSGEGGFVLRCGGSGELSFNIAGLDINQNPTSWKEVLSPVNVLTLNTWNHVAGSYDGQNLKVFVNGVEQNTNAFSGSIVASPNYPLTIGKLSDPLQFAQRFFEGKIDEVRIWHRAVPAAELMANMNNHIDPNTAVDLISYWRFNDGTGAMAVDMLGGNDLNLTSTVWDIAVPFNPVPAVPTILFNGGMLTASVTTGQWYLDGVLIPGATNMDYVPTVNGDYTFMTEPNLNGCTSTSAIFTVTSVGVQNQGQAIHVMAYPNPMIDEAIIAIHSNLSDNNTILKISDIAGHQVYSENIIMKPGVIQINIDRNMLSTGIYFYEVMNNSQNLFHGKLMVK
jgi:hypothetical protein